MFWYLSTDSSWNVHAQQTSWTKGLYIISIYDPTLGILAAMALGRMQTV